MVRKLNDYLVIGLKGIAMGAADVVPGVSGGTLAFISGIYEELLSAISNVNIDLLKNPKNCRYQSRMETTQWFLFRSLVSGCFCKYCLISKSHQTPFGKSTYFTVVFLFWFGTGKYYLHCKTNYRLEF